MLDPIESKLRAAIAARGAELVDDLRRHVGLPTGGPAPPALEETRGLLCQRLGKLGGVVGLRPGEPRPAWLFGADAGAPIPPTAVVRRPARSAGFRGTPILLSGHLDTVHPPESPFRELTIAADGLTATGPGCVDMKGGLVIAVAALESLEEAGVDADWTVVLNSDEETGSYHSESALHAEGARVAAAGGVGLVVEPALPDGSLVVERGGSGQFLIEARGRAAHVGRDFASGVSAVMALADAVLRAAGASDAAAGRIVNIGPLQGGAATNVVPDLARAWGNVRFRTAAMADELGAMLDAIATPADTPTGSLPRVEVRRSFNRPAKPVTPASDRLALLARAAAERLGQRLPFGVTGGVCDGNILQNAGLPTIDTLGVRGGGLHTPQEWIELASLVERCQLLACVIGRVSRERFR